MDVINLSAGLIASYHKAWCCGHTDVYTYRMELHFTNIISDVLCISDILLWCLVVNSSGEIVATQLYHRCWKILINFCVIKFWTLHPIRTSRIILTFWDPKLQWLSFKFNLHLLLLHLVGCVFVMSLCMPYVCIVSLCVFACISTCAL